LVELNIRPFLTGKSVKSSGRILLTSALSQSGYVFLILVMRQFTWMKWFFLLSDPDLNPKIRTADTSWLVIKIQDMKKANFRKRFFAWILKKSEKINHIIYDPYKKVLFRNISGLVVEIGPGSGVNLPYLPRGTHWIGIEPNKALHETLLSKARKRGINGKLISDNSSRIPLADKIADVFICTLVLCSVKNPQETIAEIKRILKPNGKLILIEHVASSTQRGLLFMQNIINPFLKIFADGCNCNRRTWLDIEESGFSRMEIRRINIKGTLFIHKPHIVGYALK
jgi:SAM-dependent methyltransferase